MLPMTKFEPTTSGHLVSEATALSSEPYILSNSSWDYLGGKSLG